MMSASSSSSGGDASTEAALLATSSASSSAAQTKPLVKWPFVDDETAYERAKAAGPCVVEFYGTLAERDAAMNRRIMGSGHKMVTTSTPRDGLRCVCKRITLRPSEIVQLDAQRHGSEGRSREPRAHGVDMRSDALLAVNCPFVMIAPQNPLGIASSRWKIAKDGLVRVSDHSNHDKYVLVKLGDHNEACQQLAAGGFIPTEKYAPLKEWVQWVKNTFHPSQILIYINAARMVAWGRRSQDEMVRSVAVAETPVHDGILRKPQRGGCGRSPFAQNRPRFHCACGQEQVRLRPVAVMCTVLTPRAPQHQARHPGVADSDDVRERRDVRQGPLRNVL